MQCSLKNERDDNMKEQMNWVPKKYQERVASLEREYDLIDDCKYMLYLNEDWCWDDDYWCFPVKSKKEALEYIRQARLRTDEEKEMHP